MNRRLALLLLGAVLVTGLLQASGTSLARSLGSAFVPACFALLAVLARGGDTSPPARSLALLLLSATVSALALGSLSLVVLNSVEPGTFNRASQDVEFTAAGEARLGFLMTLLALSTVASLLGLFRAVRKAASDIVPIDPDLSSHAMALAGAIAIALIPLLPLFVLGRPPLPLPADVMPAESPPVTIPGFVDRSLELGWFVLAALIVAGPGSGRTGPSILARLGLARPSAIAVVVAAGLGLTLAWLQPVALSLMTAAGTGAGAAVAGPVPGAAAEPWLPSALPGPALFGLALLASAGSEITYRGLLQPRLGLVLTNLVFVTPLAWTSGWAGLFSLFAIGLAFGALRLWTNTVAAWLAHLVFLLAATWFL